jgi:hypothetical protein
VATKGSKATLTEYPALDKAPVKYSYKSGLEVTTKIMVVSYLPFSGGVCAALNVCKGFNALVTKNACELPDPLAKRIWLSWQTGRDSPR